MILRAVKDGRWTTINNTVLNDERLSWRAKGIAAYLLSKPDDWRIDHTHLWHVGKEGRDAVLAAMKELETCRYLKRIRYQKADGKFATEVRLYEVPQSETDSHESNSEGVVEQGQETDSQEPTTENQESVNQESVSQDSLLLLKPMTETETDEDDKPAPVRDAIHEAWFETYKAEMPANQETPVANLVAECGEAAVIHGIKASVNSESRSFKFIAKCARNYIPPAPASNGNGATYRVEMPATESPTPHKMIPGQRAEIKFDERSTSTPTDPWAQVLADILIAYPSDFPAIKWLAGSRLVEAADVAGISLYQVQVCDPESVGWLTNRLGGQLRRSLSMAMGKRVLIEIVAAEPAQAAAGEDRP